MNRAKLMRSAWEIARRRRAVYGETLRTALSRALSLAWDTERRSAAVTANVTARLDQARHLAQTMTPAAIEAEIRHLDFAPRHEERISLLRLARHIQNEGSPA